MRNSYGVLCAAPAMRSGAGGASRATPARRPQTGHSHQAGTPTAAAKGRLPADVALPRVGHLDVGGEVRPALVPGVAPVGHDPTRLDRATAVDLASDRSTEPAATKRRSARTHEISSCVMPGIE